MNVLFSLVAVSILAENCRQLFAGSVSWLIGAVCIAAVEWMHARTEPHVTMPQITVASNEVIGPSKEPIRLFHRHSSGVLLDRESGVCTLRTTQRPADLYCSNKTYAGAAAAAAVAFAAAAMGIDSPRARIVDAYIRSHAYIQMCLVGSHNSLLPFFQADDCGARILSIGTEVRAVIYSQTRRFPCTVVLQTT